MNDSDVHELKTDVAVILATCQNIEKGMARINGKIEDHEERIRSLEIWQGGERVRAAIVTGVATVAGFLGGLFGK